MIKVGPVGLYALCRSFNKFRLHFLSKLIDLSNRLIFGCWIPSNFNIGNELILGYWGMAIVIHPSCAIDYIVHIAQFVTIVGNATSAGLPTIGSDIYIVAGEKILGPITIGSNSIIAANAVVVKDVTAGSLVAGVPAKIIKSGISLNEHLSHLKTKPLV